MHLANGDITVQRTTLSKGEAGVDETVQLMARVAKGVYGARSAKIRALAINIINAAGVGDKDYYGYAKAIHEWVRDEIRYIKDPVGQETLSHPEETAFNSKAGDCDDKAVLEMALLGSVGIRSYPVVIGVRPGHYSHVYLNIQIPEGGRPGRYAGETLPADPIMREWPLGQEAPAHKISAKKTYEHLAGLGTMLDGYQTGPAYLDEENLSSVRPAMRAKLVDTAARGEILNAPKIDERNTDEVDDMFTAQPTVAFVNAPPWELGPLGPVTGAEASGADRKLPVRHYETAEGVRSFTPQMKLVRPRVAQAPAGAVDPGVKAQLTDDLADVGAYIDSIMGEALGAEIPVKVAATAVTAKRAIQRALPASFLPGMGDLGAAIAQTASKANKLVKVAAATPRGRAQLRRATVVAVAADRSGATRRAEAMRLPVAMRVRVLQRAMYTPAPHPAMTPVVDTAGVRPMRRPVVTRLSPGSLVRTRGGDVQMAGMDGFFSSVASSVKKAVHKVVPKPIRKVATKVAGITTGGFITAGAVSLMGKKGKQAAYGFAKDVTGSKKWGDRYIRAARATAVAGTAVAGGALIAGVAAPAGALTTPSSLAAATSLNGAVVATGPAGAAGFTSVTFASGASAIVPSAMVPALATGSVATVTAAATSVAAATAGAAGISTALGVGLVGAAGVATLAAGAKAMGKMMPKAQATADGGVQYADENGNPISKEQYDALMARYQQEQSQSDLYTPVVQPQPIPTQVDLQNMQQNVADPYAGAYGDSSAGYAPPVDTFGPQDMGPSVDMESATSDPYGSGDPYAGGGQSFTSEVTASGDEYPAGADEGGGMPASPDMVDDTSWEANASEGTPLPRRRARRMAPAAPVEPEEYLEPEAEGEAPAYEDEDLTEGTPTGAARDLDGMGNLALPSLTTLALLGLGAYLLLKKRA